MHTKFHNLTRAGHEQDIGNTRDTESRDVSLAEQQYIGHRYQTLASEVRGARLQDMSSAVCCRGIGEQGIPGAQHRYIGQRYWVRQLEGDEGVEEWGVTRPDVAVTAALALEERLMPR